MTLIDFYTTEFTGTGNMVENLENDKKVGPAWPCSRETPQTIPSGNASHATPKRAVVQFAIAFTIALILYFVFKKPAMAAIVAVISTVVLVCGLFIPPAFLAIEKFGLKLGEWVATGLTWILLVPFFYICFVPGRIIMTLTGKDPLNLKFSSTAKTYWIPRVPVNDITRYEKQH